MKTPVVYTMGKVGSSSMSAAILKTGRACFDIHTLTDTQLLASAKQSAAQGVFPYQPVAVSMAFKDRLLKKPAKCIYIGAVRDPVARNLSAFFQNMSIISPDSQTKTNEQDVFADFMRVYSHSLPISWFDREWKTNLDIDVYAFPFDRMARYIHVSSQFLIFRVDCDDDVVSRELSAAVGQPVTVGRINDASSKDYAKMYRLVRESAAFTPDYVDRLYDTKFARHFWTDDELKEMRAKWLNGATNPSLPA